MSAIMREGGISLKPQLFNFKGQQVRTVTIENEPYFVATDVTSILGLTNTTVALNRLDNDERSKFNLGRQGEANVVNEYGLYELIIASRKPLPGSASISN